MLISEEIHRVAYPPWPITLEGRRQTQMRAYPDAWTEGLAISVSEDPYRKAKATRLARTDPVVDELWDFRCIAPKPGIRVLGAFADTDLFVALTWNQRENLPGDKEWRDEIQRCKAAWRRLFPSYQPHNGATLNDYISANFYVT